MIIISRTRCDVRLTYKKSAVLVVSIACVKSQSVILYTEECREIFLMRRWYLTRWAAILKDKGEKKFALTVMKQETKDSAVWAVAKRCVRCFQQRKCQTPQPRFCAGFGDDVGNCSCKQEKGRWVALHPPPGFTSPGNAGRSRGCGFRRAANLRWVASDSCFEIVGCYTGFALCSGALTGVVDLARNCVAKQ